ncbi:MAG TPA: MTAP family purine nucleoside phosphorylase [Acidobacteriota bacterium]|nr:MTAP family purine nucleoside phosphorylase [Acidobacteriota bacterium]
MDAKIAVIARVGAHRVFAGAGLAEISMLVPKTPFGSSNPIHLFEHGSVQFAVLSRHGEEGYAVSAPFVNDRANLWALKNLGIEKIISWSAPGSIDPNISPGDLVVPEDMLDWGQGARRELATFFDGHGQGVIRSNPAFCPELRSAFLEVLQEKPFRTHEGGVYAATAGPRMETAAEVSAMAGMGASLVGMTLSPELWLARELELCYAAVCYSVNYAEGIADRPFRGGILFEGLATEEEMERVSTVEAAFADIVLSLLPAVAATSRECPCPKLLERYYRRGDLTSDWWRVL